MNVVIIPFYSGLDMALATHWAKLNGGTHWEDYIKGLDNTITNVNKINLSFGFDTRIEFKTDADKTMFLLRWG